MSNQQPMQSTIRRTTRMMGRLTICSVAAALATLTQPASAKLMDITLPELVATSDVIMVALERPTIEFGDEVETFRATFKRIRLYKGPQELTTVVVCQSGNSAEEPDAVRFKGGYWYFLVLAPSGCYRMAWGYLAIMPAGDGNIHTYKLLGQPERQRESDFARKIERLVSGRRTR